MLRAQRLTVWSDKSYVTSVQVRVLEKDRDIDRVIITTTRIDLVDTRARSTDVERRIAGLPGQTDATNTLALLAEGRSVETLQGVDGMRDLMPSRRLPAKHQGTKRERKQCLRLARFHFSKLV